MLVRDSFLVSTLPMTLWAFIRREANFFRIHLSAFIFVPLVFSGIFYASNGQFHIKFIDALFLCYSAMTDTGLATVNLSTLTAWQQIILYLLMLLVSNYHIHHNHNSFSWLENTGRHHFCLLVDGNDQKVHAIALLSFTKY